MKANLDYALEYRRKRLSVIPLWDLEALKDRNNYPPWMQEDLNNRHRENNNSPNPCPPMEIVQKFLIDYCKRPRSAWKKYQTELPTEEEIREWWTQWPTAGIAIITGKVSGIVAFDFDSKEAWEYAEQKGGLPDTVITRTGKEHGGHVIVKRPPWDNVPNKVNQDVGIDVRADGGYIVAPFSVHGSGRQYSFREDRSIFEIEIADCLPWMEQYLQPDEVITDSEPSTTREGTPLEKSELSHTELLEKDTVKGERDVTATRIVGGLFKMGLSTSEVTEQILEWNDSLQQSLPQRDVKKIVNSIRKAELATELKKEVEVKDLLEQLQGDYSKDQQLIKENIIPAVAALHDEALRDYYLDELKDQTGRKKSIFEGWIHGARQRKGDDKKSPQVQVSQKILDKVEELQQNELAFKKRIDLLNRAGITGERSTIALTFIALDSRLLARIYNEPQTISLKSSGEPGSGKSYIMEQCVHIYSKRDELYYWVTAGSERFMYYMKDLKHKAFVLLEALTIQDESLLALAIRSILSEGEVVYRTTQKDEQGNHVEVSMRIEGPTSLITTTTVAKLEPQLEDRLFTIHPDQSPAQTYSINKMQAQKAACNVVGIGRDILDVWHHYHRCLQPVKVRVGFAPEIHKNMKENRPMSARRAFQRVLSVIKAITCFYQYQRPVNKDGFHEASIVDYYFAYQIVHDIFKETLGKRSEEDRRRLLILKEHEPAKHRELAEQIGITPGSLTPWIKRMVKDENVEWCDEHGVPFPDEQKMRYFQRTGKAYLKCGDDLTIEIEDVMGLPPVWKITDDPHWAERSENYEKYDLKLDALHVEGEDEISSESGEIQSEGDSITDFGNLDLLNLGSTASEKQELEQNRPTFDEIPEI